MPKTYAEIQDMSVDQRYSLAGEYYHKLLLAEPSLGGSPGDMAEQIQAKTGLDFATAAAVALSAAR